MSTCSSLVADSHADTTRSAVPATGAGTSALIVAGAAAGAGSADGRAEPDASAHAAEGDRGPQGDAGDQLGAWPRRLRAVRGGPVAIDLDAGVVIAVVGADGDPPTPS